MNTTSIAVWSNGVYEHEHVCHGRVNTPGMMMVTAFMKCTSIPWKAFGLCYDHGCAASRHFARELASIFGFFEFVHNVRRRGKALLGALLELLLA